ncbi:MAG: DMT family transporter [Spirochaetaceae bacterium]|jgi:drug/metabolite transporter (DMT)-like permease|nr:DMT family transporter [Spirochaetaceae bacterium]
MNKQTLRSDGLLLLTALIWGSAFIAQKTGMSYVGPFTYNGLRFLLGSLSILPLILVLEKKKRNGRNGAGGATTKRLLLSSALVGVCIFFAVSIQQIGMIYTSVANSGFITGMYVVMVPIFGIFLGRKTGVPTWIGAALAFIGLFFVSVFSNVTDFNLGLLPSSIGRVARNMNKGDILIFVASVFWTFHVLVIDALVKKVDAVLLSFGQFVVCGVLALAAAAFDVAGLVGATADAAALGVPLGPELFRPGFSFQAIRAGLAPILYGGLLSAGLAYTLQVVAQQYAPPAHASIILCLESVFAAIGGILFMSEPVNAAKLTGFFLMLLGMIATQWELVVTCSPKTECRQD